MPSGARSAAYLSHADDEAALDVARELSRALRPAYDAVVAGGGQQQRWLRLA